MCEVPTHMHHISDSNSCYMVDSKFLRDLFKFPANIYLIGIPFPSIGTEEKSSLLACLSATLFFGICPDPSTTDHSPRCESKPFGSSHRNNITLERAVQDTPSSLVNGERCLSMVFCPLIGLGDYPGGGVLCQNELKPEIM